MHYKARDARERQRFSTKFGTFDAAVVRKFYERAESPALIALVRARLLPGSSRTPKVELQCCDDHSTGSAARLSIKPAALRQHEMVEVEYFTLVHPTAEDTYDDAPAIIIGSPADSVTIRCFTCGRRQTRKALAGLELVVRALASPSQGALSCDWMT